jgi:hypothetical protein
MGRLAVSLACRIGGGGVKVEGTVVNVGFIGLGIELKAEISEIDLAAPHFVDVDELGVFDVKIRWKRGNRIGVRFSDEINARVCVQEYLDTYELALT